MTGPAAIYLDNAATSFPKPDCVYAAVDEYQRHCGAAWGRGTLGAESASSLVNRCRHRLAQLIGATDSRSVAFTFNGTDGLNLLLRGFLRPGQHVVTTTLEHNSVLRPLEQLGRLSSVTAEYVAFDPASGLVHPNEFSAALRRRPPDLVVLNHASNVTGVIQPVAELTALARDVGARVLIDAAQTAGHVDIDVPALGADMLAASGHKGLTGPLGTGFAYLSPELENTFVSLRCGGTGTESESLQQPQQMPELLESGNLNMPGLAGLNAALEWLNSAEAVRRRTKMEELSNDLRRELATIPAVHVACGDSTAGHTGVVSFAVGSTDPHEVVTILSQTFGIHCRAGLHCAPLAHQTLGSVTTGGLVRLSPGLFTTADDIARAVAAVRTIAQSFS